MEQNKEMNSYQQNPIEHICVCGAGTMGAGIAQVAAQSGFDTILYDVQQSILETAIRQIERNLLLQVDRGKIASTEIKSILGRIRCVGDINDCIADLFIEAILENIETKQGLFNQLHEVNHSEVIFASNTSSLSVTAIAEKVMHPKRVLGMHFFNPAPAMKLVEIVQAKNTAIGIVEQITALAIKMGKTPVQCMDAPGFIVNHVARPYYLEALKLVEQGVADFESIDCIMESTGFKMGPFKLMDLIGNDINYTVSNSIYEALGKPIRLQPSVLQQQKIQAGALGKKTGKGFYEYDQNRKQPES